MQALFLIGLAAGSAHSDDSLSTVNVTDSSSSEMETEDPCCLVTCLFPLLLCSGGSEDRGSEASRDSKESLIAEDEYQEIVLFKELSGYVRAAHGNFTQVEFLDGELLREGIAERVIPPLSAALDLYAATKRTTKSRVIEKWERRFSVRKVFRARNAMLRWAESSPADMDEWQRMYRETKRVLVATRKTLNEVVMLGNDRSCCCIL